MISRGLSFAPRHGVIKRLQLINHIVFFFGLYFLSAREIVFGVAIGYVLFHLGHNIGAHRLVCHRQFETDLPRRIFLNFCFCLNLLGSSIGYTIIHRKHHAQSDLPSDPHCPRTTGLFRSYLLGDFGHSGFTLGAKEFLLLKKNKVDAFFHDYYFLILLFWSLLLLMLGGVRGFVTGFVIPTIVCYHISQFQVVFAHWNLVGSVQSYDTGDNSRNNVYLKWLFLGDELHNNHHFRPAVLNLNLSNTWAELDITYYIVKIFFKHA